MRHNPVKLWVACVGVVAAWLFLWGCAAPQATPPAAPAEPDPVLPPQGARPPGEDLADETEGVAAMVREQADRLAAALAGGAAPGDEVEWLEPAPRRTPTTQPAAAPVTAAAGPAPVANTASLDIDDAAASPAPPPGAATAVVADTSALYESLIGRVRQSDEAPMVRAVAAASLGVLRPGATLEEADLRGLSVDQQEQVRRYHHMAQAIGQHVAARESLDTAALAFELERLLGEEPIRIRAVQLCKRVNGYGVYEAFPSTSFLAGREQPMIVYVELDHFRAAQAAEGQYQVKLSQELELYNEADGLAVWRQPAVEIVDESRNRRRDFFVVQLVKLPARLTVGKYVLKVRITDRVGGSLDEASVQLQVVADAALATR